MARKSAEVRREEIVEIALRHFAEGGYHGTSTEAIAREAGISQPYLFRLFGTKRELFLACAERCFGRVTEVFREAAEAAPEGERKTAMGEAYEERAAARPPHAAVPDAGLRDQRARHPRPRARRLQGAGAHDRRAGGRSPPRRRGTSSPTACCSTSSPRSTSRARTGSDLPAPAGDRLGLAGARAARRRARAAGVRRARQRERLRRSLGRGGRRPATPSPTRRAPSRRRASSRSCGWARQADSAEAPGADRARRATRCAIRAWRRWSPTSRAATAGSSPATGARPTCWPRSRTTGGGARRGSRQRLADEPNVTLGGGAFAAPQVGDQVSADIARAELIAFPILFLLTLLVFRSAVAALLPLAVGASTILLSFLAIRVVNQINPMSIFSLNLINGLGLGLAIDYSLFMVSRFREELAGGRDRQAALAQTLRTAGRVVAFSAVTVACALAALIVFRQRFLYSMGIGGALCALIAAGVSLTLLPALLGDARRARQRGRPAALEGGDRARGAGRAQRLLVPPLAARDAAAGRRRGRRLGAADRPRPAVPDDPLHGHRRVGAAAAISRRGSSTTRSGPSSRRARRRRSTSRSAPAPRPPRCASTPRGCRSRSRRRG